MIITILVTDAEVHSVFPEAIVNVDDFLYKDHAIESGIQFVKGACLHCVGDYKVVPDTVSFVIVDKRVAKPESAASQGPDVNSHAGVAPAGVLSGEAHVVQEMEP